MPVLSDYTCAMLWIKALHIVFIASWFAGLFYLPRIFVNLAMVEPGSVAERARLLLMSRKLYRFMTILAIPALALGLWRNHHAYQRGEVPLLGALLALTAQAADQLACGIEGAEEELTRLRRAKTRHVLAGIAAHRGFVVGRERIRRGAQSLPAIDACRMNPHHPCASKSLPGFISPLGSSTRLTPSSASG